MDESAPRREDHLRSEAVWRGRMKACCNARLMAAPSNCGETGGFIRLSSSHRSLCVRAKALCAGGKAGQSNHFTLSMDSTRFSRWSLKWSLANATLLIEDQFKRQASATCLRRNEEKCHAPNHRLQAPDRPRPSPRVLLRGPRRITALCAKRYTRIAAAAVCLALHASQLTRSSRLHPHRRARH
ncbi:hypothetical protein BC830DRAFT_828489 [Chytriomyces sp. MP71]|nr:hypothetical protein BC830DRAFT_828489 [Chytriomyces sp. MP71]